MTRQQKADHTTHKVFHSKAFEEGLGILVQEIELALRWNRPSILLAIHNSGTGRVNTQQALEGKINKAGRLVMHIHVDSANPDVIRTMCETPNLENMVFFVSGIENAGLPSDGKVYRALNIRRELLVEKHICVVLWLSESGAAKLARLAPDFWAFRHRVVEFAPKHGTKKQVIPVGLFLWEEQLPWMKADVQNSKLAYYEDFLTQLPREEGSMFARIDAILKLAHYSWLLNDSNKFSGYIKDGSVLLEKFPASQYQVWMLNAKGIGLFEEGSKMDACTHFAQALGHDPDNSVIMMNASIAAHGLGKNRDAILTGRRSITKDSGNYHLWRVLGYLFLSMEKNGDAIKAMTKARNLNPDDMDINYSLAVCYFKNGQPAECARELSIAKKISPPQNAIQQACIGILNGKTDDALAQLKLSLEKGEVGKHHILRDVNLHFLSNVQEFMVSN